MSRKARCQGGQALASNRRLGSSNNVVKSYSRYGRSLQQADVAQIVRVLAWRHRGSPCASSYPLSGGRRFFPGGGEA
jgi:hypothetical protein